jgi:aspartate aminotransferase
MSFIADRITSTSKKSYGMFEKALSHPDFDALIHLELGMPCHDTPEHIKQAVIDALLAGDVHYSDMRGNGKLRAALASKLAEFNALKVAPEQILITNGLTQASNAAFFATINPGDEVIVLDPFYPQHNGKIELAGGKVVKVPMDAANGFAIRADWIEPHITDRTRGIVIVNPCNPTGRVHTLAELQGLADLAIKHDLLIYADEVYEFITYDGAEHISIAALPGMAERTVSMYAFTKAYAMDGWRLGYMTASPEIIAAMAKVLSSDVTHVNTFIQHGALAAVTGPQEPMLAMVADDQRKRDMVVERLNRMPGVVCPQAQATIYLFPDVRGTGIESQVLADRILQEAKVVVEAGSFYGQAGEGFLRVCFGSVDYDELSIAMDRLEVFFNAL